MCVPLLTRCCCCVPLSYGLLVWAYLKQVLNILILECGLIVLSADGTFLEVVLSGFTLFFFDIIFSCVLIVGCHMNNTTMLRLYYRFGIAHAILFMTLSITTVMLFIIFNGFVIEAEQWDIIFIFSSICCVLLILHMYLLLLVRSEILRLKPRGQFQSVKYIADPKCGIQVDSISKYKSKEIFSEKPLPINVVDAAEKLNSSCML